MSNQIVSHWCLIQPPAPSSPWEVRGGGRKFQASVPDWFHGVGNGNPLQYSFLENPMERGTWQATVHGVVQSDTTEAT